MELDLVYIVRQRLIKRILVSTGQNSWNRLIHFIILVIRYHFLVILVRRREPIRLHVDPPPSAIPTAKAGSH